MQHIFLVPLLLFMLFQIYAAFLGISHHLNPFLAVILIAASFALTSSIVITVGAFLCAKDVWGWSWLSALIFAAPGVLLVVPAIGLKLFT